MLSHFRSFRADGAAFRVARVAGYAIGVWLCVALPAAHAADHGVTPKKSFAAA
jgi:hypothetical protein